MGSTQPRIRSEFADAMAVQIRYGGGASGLPLSASHRPPELPQKGRHVRRPRAKEDLEKERYFQNA